MKAVILLLSLGYCAAHICMWAPMQRSGVDISFPGARECFRQKGPCGVNVPGPVLTTLEAGRQVKLEFQQNLNHYTFENPGYLEASYALVANPTESDFRPLGSRIPDYAAYNMITQTNFTIKAVLPNVVTEHAVIRVAYVSNNPKEDHKNGTTFYNCADVRLVRGSSPAPVPEPVKPEPSKENADGCCTVPLWRMNTYRTGSWRPQTVGQIAYDKKNRLMRIDEVTGDGSKSGVTTGWYKMWLQFDSGIQWYMDGITGTCYAYGLDLWADWCYGIKEMSQEYWGETTIADTLVDVWRNGDFYYSTTRDKCTPVNLARLDGDLTMYKDFTTKVDPAIFVPPSEYCHRAKIAPKGTKPPVDWKEVVAAAGHPAFASLLTKETA